MLQLLGWFLKAVITIAIGILGFSWEPKSEINSPDKKPHAPAQKEHAYSVPDMMVSAPAISHFIAAKSPVSTHDCDSATPVIPLYKAVSLTP